MSSRLRGHALELANVRHVFGSTMALDGVSLSIAPGELIALLGPSGCGKTTLLRAIAGFIRPTAGDVRVDGTRVNDEPANQRNIGIVFQNYALFPHLSVFENVVYGLRCRRTASHLLAKRAAEMLELVKMSEFARRLPGQLSGGQQQRVALARALAIEPKIVLLDEPFSALDRNLRLDMQIEVKGLLKGYGLTSIMVTHDQEEALSMADRIAVLNGGRIEQVDTPTRLYAKPANLFVNRFVGHTNLLAGMVVSASAGRIAVDAGDGVTLNAINDVHCRPGSRVVVSIRPENLAIAHSAGAGTIPATVHVTLPLGPTEIVEASIAGNRMLKLMRAHTPASGPLTPGQPIHLTVTDITGVSVFPAQSPPTSNTA